jgi:hypothetical protein
MHRTLVTWSIILLAALPALAGCGSSTSDSEHPSNLEGPSQQIQGAGGDEISADDAATVLEARRTIDSRCGGTAQVEQPDVPGAVAMLIRVFRENGPDGVYETGQSERAERLSVVGRDVARQLTACGAADQATRLQRVLGASS